MVIQEDSRQQAGKHDHKNKWFENNDITIVRSKCIVGDYMLPANGSVSVDTKKDMQEVYQDVISQHERFKRELKLAKECGIKLVVLVENKDGIATLEDVEHWQNKRAERWYYINGAHERGKMLNIKIPKRPPCSSVQLYKAMVTLANRYGVEWQFCTPWEAGARIVEILSK